MDDRQAKLLQDTHDSTIRQEEILKTFDKNLAEGRVKFAQIDSRLDAVEEQAKWLKANRRKGGKLAAAIMAAAVALAAPEAWNHLLNWFRGGGGKGP